MQVYMKICLFFNKIRKKHLLYVDFKANKV